MVAYVLSSQHLDRRDWRREMHRKPLETCGLVVLRGRPHAIITDSPLLVFDAESWTRWAIHWHETEAVNAEADGDHVSAVDFSEMAQYLRDWLETHATPKRLDLPLRLRLMIKPSVVRRASLHSYLDTVMMFSSMPSASRTPDFLLYADGDMPTLFAVERMKAQLTHTGPDIKSVSLSEDKLGLLVAEECLRAEGRAVMMPRAFINGSGI